MIGAMVVMVAGWLRQIRAEQSRKRKDKARQDKARQTLDRRG